MKNLNVTTRTFLAMFALMAFACAHAAEGFSVKPEQESLVKPGMSRAEVRSALGAPSTSVRYPSEPGRTWTYKVLGKDTPPVVFDVDFNADGSVASSGERILSQAESSSHEMHKRP